MCVSVFGGYTGQGTSRCPEDVHGMYVHVKAFIFASDGVHMCLLPTQAQKHTNAYKEIDPSVLCVCVYVRVRVCVRARECVCVHARYNL